MAEKQAIAAADNKFHDRDLKSLTDESTTVNAEAEMAVGVLMARNGTVNPYGEYTFIENSSVPLSGSNSVIGNLPNAGRKAEFGLPAAPSPASNPTAKALNNNLSGNNDQIAGNSGQGYFHVSRQNMPQVALQQAVPAKNLGTPLAANSMMNTSPGGTGGLGRGLARHSMVNANNDNRNPRLVRMLFVLKSGQTTTNPAP